MPLKLMCSQYCTHTAVAGVATAEMVMRSERRLLKVGAMVEAVKALKRV